MVIWTFTHWILYTLNAFWNSVNLFKKSSVYNLFFPSLNWSSKCSPCIMYKHIVCLVVEMTDFYLTFKQLKNDALTLSFWLRPDTLTFAKYYLHFWFGWIRSELLDCLKLLMEMTLQLWTRNKKITSFFDFLINSIWAMLSVFRFKLSPKSIISHKKCQSY